MRPRFLIFTLLLVAAVLAVIYWLRPVKQAATQTPIAQQTIQPTSNPPVIANTASQNISSQPSPVSVSPENTKVESEEGKTERLVREANAPYETPIMFYARVIDQASNSLPGVKISASIYYEHLFAPTASGGYSITNNLTHLERETGIDGRFEITGEKSRNMTIESILKDGYEVEPDYCPHTFGASGGTSENPLVFKMWSTNIHEQLITGNKSFHIVPDGRTYFINLTDDTISESGEGNLKVWIKRPDDISHTKRYDWSCEVDAVNGGLCQGDSYSMFYAPAEGYLPSFQFEQKVGSGWGDSTGEKKFFVKLNNGKEYGWISIELYAYYNNQIPALIRLSYAINPSGSRILR
jgi:hypothetical protein